MVNSDAGTGGAATPDGATNVPARVRQEVAVPSPPAALGTVTEPISVGAP